MQYSEGYQQYTQHPDQRDWPEQESPGYSTGYSEQQQEETVEIQDQRHQQRFQLDRSPSRATNTSEELRSELMGRDTGMEDESGVVAAAAPVHMSAKQLRDAMTMMEVRHAEEIRDVQQAHARLRDVGMLQCKNCERMAKDYQVLYLSFMPQNRADVRQWCDRVTE